MRGAPPVMAVAALVMGGSFVGILVPLQRSWSVPAISMPVFAPTAAVVAQEPTVAWIVTATPRIVEVQVTVEVPVIVEVPVTVIVPVRVPVTVTPRPTTAPAVSQVGRALPSQRSLQAVQSEPARTVIQGRVGPELVRDTTGQAVSGSARVVPVAQAVGEARTATAGGRVAPTAIGGVSSASLQRLEQAVAPVRAETRSLEVARLGGQSPAATAVAIRPVQAASARR